MATGDKRGIKDRDGAGAKQMYLSKNPILAHYVSTSNMQATIYLLDVVHWLEGHLMSCPFKKHLHIECPGCGMQRSFVALLKGDWTDSFRLYPALLPILSLFMVLLLHLKFKFRHGAKALQWLFIFSIAIVVFSYIYKIINGKIYSIG
jgi:hypothetical protein